MDKLKKIHYWKVIFYILGIVPLVFIISLLTFYIHYEIVLGFWGISGINPYEYPTSVIYQGVVIYSWVTTFFCFLIFAIATGFYFKKNRNNGIKKIIIVNAILFALAFLLVSSPIFQFAMD